MGNWWTEPVGSGKGKKAKPEKPKRQKRSWISSDFENRQARDKERERWENAPTAKGGATPSHAAATRAKPDPYKAKLMRMAERGDEKAAERLAHMWKQENGRG